MARSRRFVEEEEMNAKQATVTQAASTGRPNNQIDFLKSQLERREEHILDLEQELLALYRRIHGMDPPVNYRRGDELG